MAEPKPQLYIRSKHGPLPPPRHLWPCTSREDLMYCKVDDNNNLVYDENVVGPEHNHFFTLPSDDNYKFEIETTYWRVAGYLHMPAPVDCELIEKIEKRLLYKFPDLKKEKVTLSVTKTRYLNCYIADLLKKHDLDWKIINPGIDQATKRP